MGIVTRSRGKEEVMFKNSEVGRRHNKRKDDWIGQMTNAGPAVEQNRRGKPRMRWVRR